MRDSTRRTLLARTVTAAPVLALPVVAYAAHAAETDPHVAWAAAMREADRACAECVVDLDADGEAEERFADEWCRLHSLILATPAQTLAGVREQVAALATIMVPGFIADERDVIAIGNMLATLDRHLAGRAWT